MPPPPLPSSLDLSKNNVNDDEPKRKLETPLAAMLPSKYQNIDVTDLFPDFRHAKVHTLFKFTNLIIL